MLWVSRRCLIAVLIAASACAGGGPMPEAAELGSTGEASSTGPGPAPGSTSGAISATASTSGPEGSTTAAESSSGGDGGDTAGGSTGEALEGESSSGGDGESSGDGSTSGSSSSTSTEGGSDTAAQLVTLSVEKLGEGNGGVGSEPGGILCGPVCESAFEVGTTVTLTAQPAVSSVFLGWSGGGCEGQDVCVLVIEEDTVVQATFAPHEPNLVFVTSTEVAPMDLAGLAGADQICADAAIDGGLEGTYVAWLSTSTVDARDRLGAARGWVRPDGRPFADTVDDLTSGIDYYPPRLDEYGNDVGGASIVTGTSTNGTGPFFSTFCADWTTDDGGIVGGGSADAGAGAWTQFWSYNCTTPQRLLCFGVDQDYAVTVNPVPGRTAFVSSAEFTGSDGLGAFDGACQSEADAAGFAGSFLAAVATSTESLASRFDTSGLPWVRPDGVAVVVSADEIDTLQHLRAPIVQTADGTRLWGDRVWTGATAPYETGPGEDACADWTDADIGNAWTALVTESEFWTSAGGRQGCDTLNRVYCLQQ